MSIVLGILWYGCIALILGFLIVALIFSLMHLIWGAMTWDDEE